MVSERAYYTGHSQIMDTQAKVVDGHLQKPNLEVADLSKDFKAVTSKLEARRESSEQLQSLGVSRLDIIREDFNRIHERMISILTEMIEAKSASKEEEHKKLEVESIVPPSDTTSQAISVEFTNGLQSNSSEGEHKLIDLGKPELGQERMHFLSANLPRVDNPEVIIEDFVLCYDVNNAETLDTEIVELKKQVKSVESENMALSVVASRATKLEVEVVPLQHDFVTAMSNLQEPNVELSRVGGVNPGKGGTEHLGPPVFKSVAKAKVETKVDEELEGSNILTLVGSGDVKEIDSKPKRKEKDDMSEECSGRMVEKMRVKPQVGLEFDLAEDAQEFHNVYATEVGFKFWIGQLYQSRVDGSVNFQKFLCSKEQESVPVGQECSNEISSTVEMRYISGNVSTLKPVGIDFGLELIHDGDIVALNNHSPISISKELGAPPSNFEVLNKSFDALISTIESLEGNWGSVFSLQSDLTPTAETNSQVVEKLEANIQKQEVKSESHPLKSDDFEPPSFETSVHVEFTAQFVDRSIMNKVAKRNQEDEMNESNATLHYLLNPRVVRRMRQLILYKEDIKPSTLRTRLI